MRTTFATCLVLLLPVGCNDSDGAEASNNGDRSSVITPALDENAPLPCLEERTEIADPASASIPGVSANDVLRMVGPSRTATVAWSQGTSAELTFNVSAPRSYVVTARRNPDFPGERAFDCPTQVRVEFDATLRTSDGRLSATTPLAVNSSEPGLATASLNLRTGVSGAEYRTADDVANRCVRSVGLTFEFATESWHGKIVETVAKADCDAIQPTTGVSPATVGTW